PCACLTTQVLVRESAAQPDCSLSRHGALPISESDTYVLDVVSVIEAVLDDPRQILSAQLSKAKGEAVAAMKAEGMEYDERMAALDRKSTRLNSSHVKSSYAVFCLKKKHIILTG